MTIFLRAGRPEDLAFARRIYFDTMRWIIERLFGWDEGSQNARFAAMFKSDEVRIITVDGQDVGWLQTRIEGAAIRLLQLYVIPARQRQGIGSKVMAQVIGEARSQGKPVTLGVVKINPARRFYEERGFRVTHEDEHKFYMTLT